MDANLIKEVEALLLLCNDSQDKGIIMGRLDTINMKEEYIAKCNGHGSQRFAAISIKILLKYGADETISARLETLCEIMHDQHMDCMSRAQTLHGVFSYTVDNLICSCDELIDHILNNFQRIMKNQFLRQLIIDCNFDWFVLRHSKITREMIDAAHLYEYKIASQTRAIGWLKTILEKRPVENIITILDWIIQNYRTKNNYLREFPVLLFAAEYIDTNRAIIVEHILSYGDVASDKSIRESAVDILYRCQLSGKSLFKTIRLLLKIGISFTKSTFIHKMCKQFGSVHFDPECFDLLIENGVDFNVPYNNTTPLMIMFGICPIYSAIPFIKKMIAHGGDVNGVGAGLMPPLLCFADRARTVDEYIALHELNMDFNVEWCGVNVLIAEIDGYNRDTRVVPYLLKRVSLKSTLLLFNNSRRTNTVSYEILKVAAALQEENTTMRAEITDLNTTVADLNTTVEDLSGQIEYAPLGDKYREFEREFYATYAEYLGKSTDK